MELVMTAHDLVFLASGSPAGAVRRLLDGRAGTWSQMIVAVNEVRDGAFRAWPELRDAIPVDRGEVLVARDAVMEQWWDESGYELNEEGEGPFAVLYRRAEPGRVDIELRQDPYGRDFGAPFQPYPATLVLAGLWLVTLVAPDPDSEFTKRLVKDLEAALVAQD
jgi:hypothetical protein